MNKEKKIVYRIFKLIWIILGVLFTLFFILSWIKMETFSGSGFAGIGGAIGVTMLFVITASILASYGIITISFLFIKWLIKRHRKKNDSH